MPSGAEVEDALVRARDFVVRQQRLDGEMPAVMTVMNEDGVVERSGLDRTVFMTMYLALALVDDPTPEVAACVRRTEAFAAPTGEVPINVMHKVTQGRERVPTWCTHCFAEGALLRHAMGLPT